MLVAHCRVALLSAFFAASVTAPSIAQETPRPTTESRPTQAADAPATEAAESAAPAAATQDPERSGRRGGRRGEGGGEGDDKKKKPKKKKKPGIAIASELVEERCASCHAVDDRGMMGRISYMRKSPEGWSTSVKRMARLYGVTMTPDEAREIVRYLSNDHGLTRGEAERSLYESERRVHWSEEHHGDDIKRACSRCHTLGRVFAQQRDDEEWKLLRAMHLAYYPLSGGMGVGGDPNRRNRGGGGGWSREGGGSSARGGGSSRSGRGSTPASSNRPSGDRGDRVLTQLAKDQPLFTDDWNKWNVNQREVPLAGRWAVTGHEIGRGDVYGEVRIVRDDEDSYSTYWTLDFSNGDHVERNGKGLLYAGYSWRGSTKEDDTKWREVLLLDEQWRHFKGRIFTGEYNEIGLDVELHRKTGQESVFAIQNRAVMIPSEGHVLDVRGQGFTSQMTADDFHLGLGVDVVGYEWVAEDHAKLTINVDRDVKRGERVLSFGMMPGDKSIVLYDTIDYIKVIPTQGLARVGGVVQPKQYERFEAIAMNRGKDDKPWTDDDYEVRVVEKGVKWSLAEFKVREDDDDIKYVGSLDGERAFFTPAIDGPNLERKWQANNIGDVYVVAEVDLVVQKLPEKKKEEEDEAEAEEAEGDEASTEGVEAEEGALPRRGRVGRRGGEGRRGGGRRMRRGGDDSDERPRRNEPAEEGGEAISEAEPEPKPAKQDPKPAKPAEAAAKAEPEDPPPIVMEKKTFRARAHLTVSPPLYRRYETLDWKDE